MKREQGVVCRPRLGVRDEPNLEKNALLNLFRAAKSYIFFFLLIETQIHAVSHGSTEHSNILQLGFPACNCTVLVYWHILSVISCQGGSGGDQNMAKKQV